MVILLYSLCSWGSGADLWGSDNDNRFEKPRIDDGLLEVVGVTGVVHMVSVSFDQIKERPKKKVLFIGVPELPHGSNPFMNKIKTIIVMFAT